MATRSGTSLELILFSHSFNILARRNVYNTQHRFVNGAFREAESRIQANPRTKGVLSVQLKQQAWTRHYQAVKNLNTACQFA